MVERTGALLQQGQAATDLLVRAVTLLHGACKSADFYTYDCIFELVAPVLEALARGGCRGVLAPVGPRSRHSFCDACS